LFVFCKGEGCTGSGAVDEFKGLGIVLPPIEELIDGVDVYGVVPKTLCD
jgi:hypothetical protein